MYYNVAVLYSEEEHGIFIHLPFASPITTDEQDAQKLFEYELRAYTNNWRGNELIYDKKIDRTTFGNIRQALVKCNEAAYLHGYYLLVLYEWSYNPHD